jgi:hypothetical protein
MTDAVDEASSPNKGSKLAATTRPAEGNGHRSHRAICFRSHAGGKRPRQGRGGPFLRCAGENDALCQQRTQGTHSCRPTALHGICECFVDDTTIRRNRQMIAQARARLVSVARRQASGCFALRPCRHNVRVPKVVKVANPPCPQPQPRIHATLDVSRRLRVDGEKPIEFTRPTLRKAWHSARAAGPEGAIGSRYGATDTGHACQCANAEAR